jgi:two-component system KDP operon response regulator KdpE
MQSLKNTILVVDTEIQTYKILDIILDKKDFDVIECHSGKQAIRLCVSVKPNIILLNLDMPDMDGKDIIASIREWSQVPFIIISAHHSNEDIINGLNMGADDYVIKPFNVDVLRARVNASLRKSTIQEEGQPELTNGPLRIDLVRHKVFLHEELISFTPKEYNLLRYFITNSGKMLTHRDILLNVWGAGHSDDTQYLRVFVGQLREKIEIDPANPKIITTELGIGYRMELLSQQLPSESQGELNI